MESIYCRGQAENGILIAVRIGITTMKFNASNIVALGGISLLTMFGNANKAQAKAPALPLTEFVAIDNDPVDADSTAQQNRDKDKIKINGADTRGQGMSLEDVQDAAMALSNKHLVVYVEVAKGDVAYENLIKDAVRENIRAGRDNIYVVFADVLDGGEPLMTCLSKGQLGLPLIKGRGHDEAAFIKRVYAEDGWGTSNQAQVTPRVADIK